MSKKSLGWEETITNDENNIDQVEVLRPLGKSDHDVIKFRYMYQYWPTQRLEKMRLNFFKGDYQNFKNFLRLINWRAELQGKDINEMSEIIEWTLKEEIQRFMPKNRDMQRRNNKQPWFNASTKRAIRNKHFAGNDAWKINVSQDRGSTLKKGTNAPKK